MQGQRTLLAFAIAAFATLNRHATILLFFVLPIQARWFLWLEVLFAFIAFLATKDLAGFVGICVVVGGTYALLSAGGPGRMLPGLALAPRSAGARARARAGAQEAQAPGARRGGGEKGGGEPRQGPWVH
jgi:hypothetical protein